MDAGGTAPCYFLGETDRQSVCRRWAGIRGGGMMAQIGQSTSIPSKYGRPVDLFFLYEIGSVTPPGEDSCTWQDWAINAS